METLGRLLCYADKGWDMNQRAGYPALIDWTWNGSYEMAKYKGRHWMSYFGGEGTGYEAIRKPLNMGMASTKGDITQAHPWETSPSPVLSINDKSAQWWENSPIIKAPSTGIRTRRWANLSSCSIMPVASTLPTS